MRRVFLAVLIALALFGYTRIAESAEQLIVKLEMQQSVFLYLDEVWQEKMVELALEGAQDLVGAYAEAAGCTVGHRYRYIPYMAMSCPDGARAQVAVTSGVSSVTDDAVASLHQAGPQLGDTIPLIGAAALHGINVLGQGQAIAVLDTGVESTHPAFNGNRVVHEGCFAINGDCPDGTAKMIGPGAGAPCTFASACFHGTHVAGIVGANEPDLKGTAPAADIIAVRVFTNNSGNASAFFSDIIQAYEHLIDLVGQGVPVRAANMSLGTGPRVFPCDEEFPALKAIIDVALENGIASAVSSGNGSNTEGLSSPSCLSNTISVGCTDKNDSVCSFSNSALGLDVWAPGLSVFSSDLDGGHSSRSGTSMSAPHVAGSFALIYAGAGPTSIQQAINALKETGQPVTDSRNGVTVNRIRVSEAVAALPPGSECGDNVREGPEQCDGTDDEICPGECLADCTCDRAGCPPCPDPPLCDSCCSDPPPCAACDSCCPECPDCPIPPCPPVCSDSDNDGHANDNDKCPFTPPGEAVDELGCSQREFCERIDARSRVGARACKRADWKNDQPLRGKTFECRFDNKKTFINRRDDECLKGVR